MNLETDNSFPVLPEVNPFKLVQMSESRSISTEL